MNEKKDQISSEQALEVIKSMIENSRQKQRYAGFYHLLWGVLISLAIGTMYLLLKAENYSMIGFSWAGYSIVGAILSITHSKKNYINEGSKNYPDIGIGAIWISLMVAMVLVCFVFPYMGAYGWEVIYIMVCLLLGIGNLVTGLILKEKLPIINGILWWLGSIALLFMNGYFSYMALFVGLLFINNILPGTYMLVQERKNHGK